ncbi:MAG: AMIN domain-containing protein, partial [Thermodesulfovibrionales bacterium]
MKKGFFVFLILLLATGCATKGQVKPVEEQAAITGITIEDNTLTIGANRPFSYTIYRSADDPFKVIAELQDILPGAITPGKKIISDKKGISEITPILMEGKGLRLEITLQAPLKEEAEFKDNVLIVKFFEEAPSVTGIPQPVEQPKEKSVSAISPAEENKQEIQPALPSAREIRDITLSRKDGMVEIEIIADGEMKPNVFPLDKRIVIDIPGAVSKAKAPEAIAPLRSLRIGKHPDKTRIVLDMTEKSSYEVNARGNRLVVAVMAGAKEEKAEAQKKEELGIESEKKEVVEQKE